MSEKLKSIVATNYQVLVRLYLEIPVKKLQNTEAVAGMQCNSILTQCNCLSADILESVSTEELPGYYKRKETDEEFVVLEGTREKVPVKVFLKTLKCNSGVLPYVDVLFAELVAVMGDQKFEIVLTRGFEV
jgi:hypothetical protein